MSWRLRGGTVHAPATEGSPNGTSVLFLRDVRSFHGGHLKVRDYFDHVRRSADHHPLISFSPQTVWDHRNPWHDDDLREVDEPSEPDILFLAGRDWARLRPRRGRRPTTPVINLIQHVRHADPGSDHWDFLRNKAIRICVSAEVADAVEATGRAEGPVLTIPNGTDVEQLRAGPSQDRTIDLLIVANKQPELGHRVADAMGAGRTIRAVDETIPRPDFLDELRRARVTLFLPNEREGFYLPALEGMALGTLVVCPDCIGNRSFCLPGQTAFRPPYREDDIRSATLSALELSEDAKRSMLQAASRTAEEHDLTIERTRFYDVMRQIRELWAS